MAEQQRELTYVKPKGRWANYRPSRPRCARCGVVIVAASPSKKAVYCGRVCYARSRKRTKARSACRVCGKSAPNTFQKSCSKKCADILRATTPLRTCKVCQKEYRPSGRVRLKYCSLRCYNSVRCASAFETFACAHCHKPVTRRKVRTRPRVQRFCGKECAGAFNVGANNRLWRGGGDPNRGAGWVKLAAKIRERDNYTCRRCRRTQAENGEALAVDHVRPWRSFSDKNEANDPSNLVSLCKKCHGYKTTKIERAWLKGDRIEMQDYERAVALP